MTMDRATFLIRLENVENLPTLPVIVQQIQKLIANPNSNMAQIAAIIAKDQAIAARVVRLINSAFYGMSGKVASIQQAIVLLGLNTVKNLVVGVSVVKMFEDAGTASIFDRQKFWMHTFACALGARAIGREMRVPEPEDFFLAGLLHDIGILVLDQFFHQEFIDILHYAVGNKTDYTKAEMNILGITHQEVGEYVARKWKIPEMLMHSIRHHHSPVTTDSSCAGSILSISAVHVADIAAFNRGLDMGYKNGVKPYHTAAMKSIGISESRVSELFDGVEKEVNAVATEWGV
jgi:HD-like signal output (HDOD) protein